jgi:hypothetical protein
MAEQTGLDWPGYLGSLPEDDACALAAWLSAQGLHVGEFMEVVDRAYATWPEPVRGHLDAFMHVVGRPCVTSYAFRKRHFARLVAMLEEAMASGALPGEVAPHELDLPVKLPTEGRSVEELLACLEHVAYAP